MARLTWTSLNRSIQDCCACPRLIEHCRQVSVTKRRSYADFNYWGRPVPNFGSARAQLLIVGLAPGAHGANRTGRMFTGDRSGDWLFRALYRAGFANQPTSQQRDDGLKLQNCAITAVCHCAPPQNKPRLDEVLACQKWLDETVSLLKVRVFVALGQIAWKATVDYLRRVGTLEGRRPQFGHGAEVPLTNQALLIGCYHPSQQNTFTGRLTEPMLDDVFAKARHQIDRFRS